MIKVYWQAIYNFHQKLRAIHLLNKKFLESKIDTSVVIKNSKKVWLGKNTEIRRNVYLNGRSNRDVSIRLSDGVCIRDGSYLDCYGGDGNIFIGEKSQVGQNVYVGGNGGVEIGKNVMISGHTYIVSATHNYNVKTGLPYFEQGETRKPVSFGDNCWVASNCVVLNGVHIGSNSVVGAGSVVTENIPDNCLAVGIPATNRGSSRFFKEVSYPL